MNVNSTLEAWVQGEELGCKRGRRPSSTDPSQKKEVYYIGFGASG